MRHASKLLVAHLFILIFAGRWAFTSDWLHFGADSVYSAHNLSEKRLGLSNVSQLEQLWGIGCNDGWFSVISSSPAIFDGTLYNSGAGDRLTAYDARSGRELWAFGNGNMGWAAQPVVSENGTVFYMEGNYPTELYAVNGASGEQIWQAPLAFELGYSDTALVTVDEELQRVYVVETPFGGDDGKLFALEIETGEVAWWKGQVTDDLGFKGDFVLMRNSLIYVVAVSKDQYGWPVEEVAVIDNENLIIQNTFSRPADIDLREISRFSICGNTLIVNFCDRDDVFESEGILVAFDLESGAEKWRLDVSGAITGRLACNETREVVYVPNGPYMRAIDAADGSEIWNFLGYDDVLNPSLANGVLYFISDTNMYAFDEESGEQLFRFGLGEQGYETTQVAIADGMVFFSGNGGPCDLYALGLPGDNPEETFDGFIPAAARNAGAGGTFWQTTVWAFQDEVDMATLVLRAGNTDKPAIQNEAQRLNMARGQVVRIDDVLSLFPDISPPAALFYSWLGVESDQAIVTSRTYTGSPGGAEGTLGQGIQGIELGNLPSAGASHVVPLSPDNDRVRSNLGVVNADAGAADFVLRIRSETGVILDEIGFELPAGSWRQFNSVFANLGLTPADRAYAEVMTTAAGGQSGTPFFAVYSSLVDNVSGDPTYLAGQWAGSFGEIIVPVAAHNPGANDTEWVTDISTLNWQGLDPALCSFTFLAEGVANHPSPAASQSFSVDQNHNLYLSDIVYQVFGESNRKGAIASSGLADNRWSRIYNVASTGNTGTFGQGLPGLKVADHEISGVDRGVIIGLEESDRFRSNLGFVNTSNEENDVTVLYMNSSGAVLGSAQFTMLPRGMEQISAPFAALGGVSDGRVQVSSERGVLIYASVVDNTTGDASTVLSKRLQ